MNELKINGYWKSVIAWFMGEKKKTLNIRSLPGNIRFIIEFIMNLLSLMAPISFIVFSDSLGLENLFNRFVNEV